MDIRSASQISSSSRISSSTILKCGGALVSSSCVSSSNSCASICGVETVSVSTSNKRKRRGSQDVKETDDYHPSAKRTQYSQYQSSGPPSSSPSIANSPVDAPPEMTEPPSSSDCRSHETEFDLGALSSPASPSMDVKSCQSNTNSCTSFHTRGDITPHSNKRSRKRNANCIEDCCATPTKNLRLCPLPALSWANAADVWNLMCEKDSNASKQRQSSMLENHPGLQPKMRAILLDWLIEVCEVYKLHRETYYLAVDYLDRYLYKNRKVQKTHLQLIGITCLFIAAKVEEIYPPKINEFAYVTDGACQEDDILQHELLILKALDWSISPVTIIGWLGVYMQLNVSNRTPASFSNRNHSNSFNQQNKIQNSLSSKKSEILDGNDLKRFVNSSLSRRDSCNLSSTSSSLSVNVQQQDTVSHIKCIKTNRINTSITSCSTLDNCNSDRKLKINSKHSLSITKGVSESRSSQMVDNCDDDEEEEADECDRTLCCVDDENEDTFIYPQFSAMEFSQTAQLIDLCSLDLGIADHPYSVIAAAAISHTLNREIAVRVSGLEWSVIEKCAKWMEPFFQVICEEPQSIFLTEQNEQVKSKFGLGHICPNIVTDDSHIIQTHSTTMDMLERALFKREQYNAAATIIRQEASPAVNTVCPPPGLLTPPASSRKPGDLENNEPELQNTKTS